MAKYLCRCGIITDQLKSYFTKSGSRVTVCINCAKKYGLDNEDKFYSIEYNQKLKDANNK